MCIRDRSHVEHYAAPFLFYLHHGRGQLLTAVAPQRSECVTCQAFGVDSAQQTFAISDLTLHQGNVVLPVEFVDIAVGHEVAVFGRHLDDSFPFHQLLVLLAIILEHLDSDELHPVLLRQLKQLALSHHGTVILHDLAAETALLEACQPKQIHGSFRMSISLQHTVFLGL